MPRNPANAAELLLIEQIREGDENAWQQLIQRYEGRLFAFVRSRLNNAATSEDVVQETFMGFLISLPNYDERTPIETYLFSIAAHKLTDNLRREGRRPTVPLMPPTSDAGSPEPEGKSRKASSLIRSREQKATEAAVLAACLADLIEGWRKKGEYERLKCMELLLVRGMPNKTVAEILGITEQDVANHKHYVIQKIKKAAEPKLRNFSLEEFGLA